MSQSASKRIDVLKLAGTFLLAGYYGKPFTRQEMKRLGDLCFLAIPMKYRLPRDEFAKLVAGGASTSEIAECGKETEHARVTGTHFCRCTHVMYD